MFCGECGVEDDNPKRFCKSCGATLASETEVEPGVKIESLGDNREAPPKTLRKTSRTSGSAHTCPRCMKDDAVQKVSVIVDGGTTTTIGGMAMTTWSSSPGLSTGIYGGVSSSALSSRLQIASPSADFNYSHLAYGVVVVGFFVWRWASDGVEGASLIFSFLFTVLIALIPGIILGAIWGAISKKIRDRKLEPSRVAVYYATQELRDSYYCQRDDFVFNGKQSGSPEDYIEKLVNKHL